MYVADGKGGSNTSYLKLACVPELRYGGGIAKKCERKKGNCYKGCHQAVTITVSVAALLTRNMQRVLRNVN